MAVNAKKGEIFSATVRDLASDGRGVIAHPSGLTVFVPGVWPGETGDFRFLGLQRKLGLAELVALTEPAPQRVSPQCPHHGFTPGQCGGCPWQFMDYPAQLAAKQQRVTQALQNLTDHVLPIWPSPHIYGYRNRAQLKTDGEQLGYITSGSNTLAPIGDCPILTAPNRDTLQGLLAQLPNPAWRPHKAHQWTNLHIDESVTADTLVPNQRRLFQQSNSAQNQRMGEWLANQLQEIKQGIEQEAEDGLSVLELFAGSGNFTEVIAGAEGIKRIVAVDGVGPAIEQLESQQLPKVTALARDLFQTDAFPRLHHQHGPFDILVLDPPREGLKNREGLFKKKKTFQHIFYISCDLATFKRDAQFFQEAGYRLCDVQPLDQAPHTPHIELLASFKHKNA